MANIPLKSIKFPDLADTYTVPSNAGELPYNKSATYPADTVGKALQNIGDSSAPAIIETATGSIASFTDGANLPVKDLIAEIVPLQSGSGDPSPDNVRAISGWTECNVSVAGDNLFGGIEVVDAIRQNYADVVVDTANKSFHYSPLASEGYLQVAGIVKDRGRNIPFKPNTQYTFIIRIGENQDMEWLNLGVSYTDGTNNGGFWKADADANGWIVFTTPAGKSVRNLYGGIYGSTSIEIYYDDFGIFEGTLTKADFEPYNGEVHTISFASAGTVYGGRLDVTSGVLVVDRAMVDIGDLTWQTEQSGVFSSPALIGQIVEPQTTTDVPDIECESLKPASYVELWSQAVDNTMTVIWKDSGAHGKLWARCMAYANATDFRTAMTGKRISYPITNPTTYQLTPTKVKTLLKNNNIWADTGDVTVEYVADTKTFIENLVNA